MVRQVTRRSRDASMRPNDKTAAEDAMEKKIVATGAWDKDIEAAFKAMISEYKATGSW